MARRPRQASQPWGNSYDMLWANTFTPSDDRCKDICLVQILEPILKRKGFNDQLIIGMNPYHMDIRFVSVMPSYSPTVPDDILTKALHESRNISANYRHSDRSYIPNARRLIKHMHKLIQAYY